MNSEVIIFNVDGIDYKIKVTRKMIKSSYIRLRKDGSFSLSTSPRVNLTSLSDFITKAIRKLNKWKSKRNNEAITDKYVFILGKKVIPPVNRENLLSWMKSNFINLVTQRVRYYESIMNINKPYNIRVGNASTRFGSNSVKTHTLAFSVSIYHYSLEVIDSVVIHELAHDKIRNHSEKFYNIVYKYCPNYKIYRKRLIRQEYGTNNE